MMNNEIFSKYANRGSSYVNYSGSDCVICTKEEPNQPGLEILHITEGLSFHPKEEIVKIHLDLVSHNGGDASVRYRVIHRGKTEAALQRFAFKDAKDPREEILASLYANRIKHDSENSETIQFHKRVNCLGIDPVPIGVSLVGPGECFGEETNRITLNPEIEDAQREDIAFTSYLIPPHEMQAIPPGETAICTVKLEISKASYRRLVGSGSQVSVESYSRLMRYIETYDLPTEPNYELRNLYSTHVRVKGAIIEPREYDIVIFQELGQAVKLESGSISTTPVPFSDIKLPSDVLWFFGQSGEFCLNLKYLSDMSARKQEKMVSSA